MGGVNLQEREGEENHMPIKAVLACVWGSHIGNTSVPSLNHELHLYVFTRMLTSYVHVKNKEIMYT